MSRRQRTNLGLHSKGGTYTLVMGVVIGMLIAGLAIPFVFGEQLESVPSNARPLVPRADADLPGDATGDARTEVTASEASPESTGAAKADGPGTGGTALAPGTQRADPEATEPDSDPALSEAPGGLTASDRGVTPDTINLAFLIVDLGGVSQFGFSIPGFDPEAQRGYVRAFVDDTNARGGVFGRTIEPLFFSYDPTDPSSGQAACRAATQDHEIFAALDVGGGLDFPGQLCFTEQNRTPLIELGGFGTTQEMYDKSEGRLVTLQPSGVRTLANMAHELVNQGLLEGKRIGIVDRDFPGTVRTVTDGMVATLERLGYEVTYRADLSPDNGVATSQIPVAVQQMRANRVDAVMLLMDFITSTEFVQTADRSGYTPDYFVSDFGSMTNDIALSAMPESFRSVGITTMRIGEWRIGSPEPAVDAACRETYAASSGEDPHRSDNDYGGAMLSCGMVDLFVRAATLAGPELTREGWVTGVQQIGALDYPFFGGMSFGPGKVDGADHIRTLVAEASCPPAEGQGGRSSACWMPVGDFRPPHY
ncbi:MAG: ABC transporter substrate-binding protein [Actinobacteria bacterium]|nr:ABC transporter substrate-binding protein [Actinomycetota bacterium]